MTPNPPSNSPDATPKYQAIFEALRHDILTGKYATAPFPSEHTLMARFGVARGTIRHALRLLKDKRMLDSAKRQRARLTRGAMNMGERIGLIIPGFSHEEIFPPICHELAQLAQQEGFVLILGDIAANDPVQRVEQARSLAREYARQRVSGVVYQPVEFVERADLLNREILSIFTRANIPVVLLDYDIVPPPERSEYDLVSIDNFEAGSRIGAHLLSVGARKIAFWMRPNWAYSVRNRLNGLRSVLAEAGRDPRNIVIVGEPDDRAKVAQLLDAPKAPDAFVCGNDVAAAKLIDSIKSAGRRVPQDILVAGFDDVRVAKLITPRLTTLHQPCEEIAAALFELLVKRIRTPDAPPRTIVVKAPLFIRESTSRPHSV